MMNVFIYCTGVNPEVIKNSDLMFEFTGKSEIYKIWDNYEVLVLSESDFSNKNLINEIYNKYNYIKKIIYFSEDILDLVESSYVCNKFLLPIYKYSDYHQIIFYPDSDNWIDVNCVFPKNIIDTINYIKNNLSDKLVPTTLFQNRILIGDCSAYYIKKGGLRIDINNKGDIFLFCKLRWRLTNEKGIYCYKYEKVQDSIPMILLILKEIGFRW